MGAMETMMLDMGASQIGKSLGLPTHAYIGLSDSKCVDAQAGLETGIGAVDIGCDLGCHTVDGDRAGAAGADTREAARGGGDRAGAGGLT